MKKPEKKGQALEILAGDVSQTRWMLGLNTAVRGFKELQSDISSERDRYAAEFARHQIKHAADSEKGGAASAQVRRSALALRNEEIVREAGRLRAAGRADSEICSILAMRGKPWPSTARHIRTILQDEGFLEKRGK